MVQLAWRGRGRASLERVSQRSYLETSLLMGGSSSAPIKKMSGGMPQHTG